jgi:hypothetical protein
MALPRRQIFTLPEIAVRWNVGMADLACYAVDEILVFSTVVRNVRVETGYFDRTPEGETFRVPGGEKFLKGVAHLYGVDIWPVFKGQMVKITRFRADEPDHYLMCPFESEGVPVKLDDLVLTRAAIEVFEQEQGVGAAEPATNKPAATSPDRKSRPPGPGAPLRHDWDGFYIELCRQIHENGLPSTQAALVRKLMDWFHDNADQPPDESTVRRKITRFWKAGVGA